MYYWLFAFSAFILVLGLLLRKTKREIDKWQDEMPCDCGACMECRDNLMEELLLLKRRLRHKLRR